MDLLYRVRYIFPLCDFDDDFVYTRGDPTRVYYGTDTRLFSIWLGSALAFVWPSTRLKKNIPKQAKSILNIAGGISLLALILCFFFLDDHYNFIYYGGMLLVSLLCVVLVAVTAHPWSKLESLADKSSIYLDWQTKLRDLSVSVSSYDFL